MASHPAFKSYRGAYLGTLNGLIHTQLIATVAAHAMMRFPSDLPLVLKKVVLSTYEYLATLLAPAINVTREDRENSDGVEGDNFVGATVPMPETGDLELDRFGVNLVHLTFAQDFASGARLPNFGSDASAIAARQAVTMTFAHVDAFLADSLRTICHCRPETLRSISQISRQAVFELGTLEASIEHITERHVYEFGWLTIAGRVRFLQEKCGLALSVNAETLDCLSGFEQMRHLIVHHGGMVTTRYRTESDESSLRVGRALKLSGDDLDALYSAAKSLCSDVCLAVSTKFLGATREDLQQVWLRAADENSGPS